MSNQTTVGVGDSQTPQSAPRQPGEPLTFLVPNGVRRSSRAGVEGLSIRTRLTSYRSLPLSCVREVSLSIDGEQVDPARITVLLDGHGYKLDELADRNDLWWYILDYGELFVTSAQPLASGHHVLEGSLTMLLPFATGGRTTETSHSRIEVDIDEETAR